jgi:hypothetical protein
MNLFLSSRGIGFFFLGGKVALVKTGFLLIRSLQGQWFRVRRLLNLTAIVKAQQGQKGSGKA